MDNNRNWNEIIERMAAWQETSVVIGDRSPNAAISTYDTENATALTQILLAKLMVYIESDLRWIGPESAEDLRVEDVPGGVKAEYAIGDVTVRLLIAPLMFGREDPEKMGAALFRVSAEPAVPVLVRCGGSSRVDMVGWQWNERSGENIGIMKVCPRDWLADTSMRSERDEVFIDRQAAIIRSEKQPLPVAVTSQGDLAFGLSAGDTPALEICFPSGTGGGDVLIGFAPSPERALRIVREMDADAELKKLEAYYDELLSSRIVTPEPSMDEAFASAIRNQEYNWFAPYGWLEAIHHWFAMWHMQNTAAADWLGQTDRSKSCILTRAERLYENGAVAMMYPNGELYRDWGGTNQFYAWQVRHYWKFTADLEFARSIAPVMDRVIAQTLEEYDPEGDGLLAWGEQIGNQEDYLSHLHGSAIPTMEFISMLRTRMEIAEALADEPARVRCEALIARSSAALRRELWRPDLGRYMFYKDPHGMERLDAAYQAYVYPAIHDMAKDRLDAWTGIRHLRDRLTGPNGELFASNHFPTHATLTLGCQAAVAQQPWGAMGLAAAGLRNEAYKPLKLMADWVTGDPLKGAWPENTDEHVTSYFSPPAAMYIQAIAESLFGLQVDKAASILHISPSFPDHWPGAELRLPEYKVTYRKEDGLIAFEVHTGEPMVHAFRWLLPVGRVTEVTVNETAVGFETRPGVGCIELVFDTPPLAASRIGIGFSASDYRIGHPLSVAEGDKIAIEADGAFIRGIDDRCGVLMSTVITNNSRVEAVIRDGLLAPYSGFGNLGTLNFARRTFFLSCETPEGIPFWHPVDLTLLAAAEAEQTGEWTGLTIPLNIRNNTFSAVSGNATFVFLQQMETFAVDLPPRSEAVLNVPIPAGQMDLVSAGGNAAHIRMPSGQWIDLTLTAGKTADNPAIAEAIRSRTVAVPLPEERWTTDDNWQDLRRYLIVNHMPWTNVKSPLKGLDSEVVRVPGLPFDFRVKPHNWIPLSSKIGQPELSVTLEDRLYKKFYLLLVPLLTNHDMFSPVFRLHFERDDGRMMGSTFRMPGDLDWFWPEELVGLLATSGRERPNRHGLLPLLRADESDWREGRPLRHGFDLLKREEAFGFPQPEYWSRSLCYKTVHGVFSVIEVDFGQGIRWDRMRLSLCGVDPAIGILAVHAEVL
ncbi:hypothetical protein [Cohnella silvisoli]|uniref:Alpha-L-rhamnosidase six-hairpin glycosidase domain-containing protein n=1 Tax=Cohnella silvisoli TaxID=2873699 RepID=A0ABV1L449_9BACL|nr:hypothetical protein [Cohnella silvisoli]MCD9026410.1 hypothetical protein [Cohnella silvisoli]